MTTDINEAILTELKLMNARLAQIKEDTNWFRQRAEREQAAIRGMAARLPRMQQKPE